MRKLYHGACYYPELWDEETIQQDIDIMREVGVNVVRIGEFAWSVMEPEEGKIDVGFFKEIIARLYESGIETIMCTPTLTPPIWFSHGRPERMHVNEKERSLGMAPVSMPVRTTRISEKSRHHHHSHRQGAWPAPGADRLAARQ